MYDRLWDYYQYCHTRRGRSVCILNAFHLVGIYTARQATKAADLSGEAQAVQFAAINRNR